VATEGQALQYYFDGEDWYQKLEKKLDVSAMLITNNFQKEIICQQVLDGELSPLAYHIYNNSFSISVLSSYTGISKRHIKKHLKPKNFNQLDEETLKKYATVFEISIDELKKIQI
jgi:hypothetical protein